MSNYSTQAIGRYSTVFLGNSELIRVSLIIIRRKIMNHKKADEIRQHVRQSYTEVAEASDNGGCCGEQARCCGVSSDTALTTLVSTRLGYNIEDLNAVPEGWRYLMSSPALIYRMRFETICNCIPDAWPTPPASTSSNSCLLTAALLQSPLHPETNPKNSSRTGHRDAVLKNTSYLQTSKR